MIHVFPGIAFEAHDEAREHHGVCPHGILPAGLVRLGLLGGPINRIWPVVL